MKRIHDLPHFIKELENNDELIRITAPVSADLEISEIYFRHARSRDGGKALLFENVEGSSLPVLINAMGSHRRMEIAFGGRKMDEVAEKIRDLLTLLKLKKPEKIVDFIAIIKKSLFILRLPPKRLKKKGACQQVVLTGDQIDLNLLPVLKSWPEDAGRFITLPLVFTKSLKDGAVNVGMYRMQILDRRTTAMHWQIHKDGSNFHDEYIKENKRMPVSVVIGADPSVVFSAISPMPPKMNELMMAGLIRGKGVSLVKCITNDLYVPENSEIVLEGYVDPHERVDEGPFGDHTGYYTPVEKFPVFHITAITMKKNPVYMTTVVGRSPQEDCYIAAGIERIFLPMFQMIAPEVTDQMLPWDGCFHNCAVVSIKKEFPYQSRKLMNHLWGFSQMSFSKSLVVVDEGVDLNGGENLMKYILNTVRLSDDLIVCEGILDQLDHSGI
ncbi:MAG: menaquinone biosynthesis decarboxylase, partial [Spirochaetia bacterium]|nr:menaquinone biosynthesis decarboxylase [Spirochaetia bacterium]